MAEKSIVWTVRASLELQQILDFYNRRNGNSKYSLKILHQVESLLHSILNLEYIGRITSNHHTRVFPMDVYLIFYDVTENGIEVLSFWDNRQEEKNRLDL